MLGKLDYHQPTLTLARNLLGNYLVRKQGNQVLSGRIVEVEAYHQDGDRAAHSFAGKTPRNAVMFGPPGFLYVYFIYGMHYCMNVVTEAQGIGAAILIRAMEPLEGIETMRLNRGPQIPVRDLTNGPAKCCRAFAVDNNENGLSLMSSHLFLEEGAIHSGEETASSPRIGISKSRELPWRFFLKNNPYLSGTKLTNGGLP